jgi:DNA-binding NtrC family response regulator
MLAEVQAMHGTVVIADADPTVRKAIRYGLSRAGVKAVESASGTAALIQLVTGRGRVAAVVAGHPIDDLDGAALVAAVRAVAPAVPIFLFCGDSLDSTEIWEAEVYLKPYGLLEMCAAVAEAVGVSCRVPAAA